MFPKTFLLLFFFYYRRFADKAFVFVLFNYIEASFFLSGLKVEVLPAQFNNRSCKSPAGETGDKVSQMEGFTL